MMEGELHIRFFSDWHCGSGLGESHLADAVICRDHDGIPILPGRAVKGALREGAWRLCALGEDYEQAASLIFGSVSHGGAVQQAGHVHVASARLPQDIRDYLRSLPHEDRTRQVSHMVSRRSRTALQDGMAHSGTLPCGKSPAPPALPWNRAASFFAPSPGICGSPAVSCWAPIRSKATAGSNWSRPFWPVVFLSSRRSVLNLKSRQFPLPAARLYGTTYADEPCTNCVKITPMPCCWKKTGKNSLKQPQTPPCPVQASAAISAAS